jgi:hypothetical protein
MVEGKRFVVSVRQLSKHFGANIPETKEGSYQWANLWLKEKVGAPEPKSAEVEEFERKVDWARQYDPGLLQGVSSPLEQIKAIDSAFPSARSMMALAQANGIIIPDTVPSEILNQIFGADRLWQDRLGRQSANQVPTDKQIGPLVDRYLETVYARYKANEIKVSEYSNCRSGVFHFRDWLGSANLVDVIDARKWEAYHLHLIGESGPKSIDTRRKFFRYARNWIGWMSDLGIAEAPPNLNRRQYRFKGGRKKIPTASIEMVRAVVASSRDRLRLCLLLMLNCGFIQADISELSAAEVDWENGRILRKRTKEADHESVPEVDYPLWGETFRLLQEYHSEDPAHVFLTDYGTTWVRDWVDENGDRHRTDGVRSAYRHLTIPGMPTLKVLRKAASSLLDSHPEHGKFAIHFLGQARTIAHQHYINQNGPAFDGAVRWLGEQYGFPTARRPT